MANDDKKQALECGSGSKDWLEPSANQHRISQMYTEVGPHESFASVVTHDAAKEQPRSRDSNFLSRPIRSRLRPIPSNAMCIRPPVIKAHPNQLAQAAPLQKIITQLSTPRRKSEYYTT